MVTSREHMLSVPWIGKMIFSLGLYIFWWNAHKLIITPDRVVHRSGVFGKSERTILIDRVQDVSVSQGLFGRIFGHGTIRIESSGSGNTEIEVRAFSSPNRIKELILGL